MKLCAKHDAPVIAFGTGTSLEGHLNAPHGGVSIDFSRMNRVIEVVTRLRELSPLYEMAKEGVDLSKLNWKATAEH